jgi:hypothetical protein
VSAKTIAAEARRIKIRAIGVKHFPNQIRSAMARVLGYLGASANPERLL